MAKWVFPAQVTLTQNQGEHRHPGLFGEPLSRKQTYLISITGRKPGGKSSAGHWRMTSMHRQYVSAACRKAARTFSLGCQLWELALPREQPGSARAVWCRAVWGRNISECVHTGAAAPISVEPVLCALLGLSEGRPQPRSWVNTRG